MKFACLSSDDTKIILSYKTGVLLVKSSKCNAVFILVVEKYTDCLIVFGVKIHDATFTPMNTSLKS